MELNTIQNKSNWGKATESINTNFAHVGSEIDKLKYAAYNSKLYPSLEVLQQEKPNPSVGDWAIVGNTIPGAIYRCSTEGVWSATGETGGGYGMNVTEKNVTENNHYGDIVNNPDNEDLIEKTTTEGTKVIQFADKEYNETKFSGLGRVYLRKSESDSKNVLTQEMINRAKTRYIIQYDYDLNGAEITLPEGCVLQFEGGSFSNGTINGNNSKIESLSAKIFDKTIILKNFDYVKSEWIGIVPNIDCSEEFEHFIQFGLKILFSAGTYRFTISNLLLSKFTELVGEKSNESVIFVLTPKSEYEYLIGINYFCTIRNVKIVYSNAEGIEKELSYLFQINLILILKKA